MIKRVIENEKEGVSVVVFKDGNREVLRLHNGDKFIHGYGTALNICKYLFGRDEIFELLRKFGQKDVKIDKYIKNILIRNADVTTFISEVCPLNSAQICFTKNYTTPIEVEYSETKTKVLFADGHYTVVESNSKDKDYSTEKEFMMCLIKNVVGDGYFYSIKRKYL